MNNSSQRKAVGKASKPEEVLYALPLRSVERIVWHSTRANGSVLDRGQMPNRLGDQVQKLAPGLLQLQAVEGQLAQPPGVDRIVTFGHDVLAEQPQTPFPAGLQG